MLSDLYEIQYRHPRRTPVQLIIEGNRLTIDCCFRYNRRALRRTRDGSQTLADLIEDGIRRSWSGLFPLDLPGMDEPVEVTVDIHRDRRRRAAPIHVRRLLLMPAHVGSPFYRRIWGILKTGQLESLGTNWSLEQPGCIVLPANDESWGFGQVAAHEAGHLFGLGDAYAAIYRFYHAAPETEQYMMHSNCAVQPAEILMLLRAHQTGKMQYFPRQWNSRRFISGFRRDLAQRAARLQQRWAAWRRE